MRIRILVPHQTINGEPVAAGGTVEVSANEARRLIHIGYATEAPKMPTEAPKMPTEAPKTDAQKGASK